MKRLMKANSAFTLAEVLVSMTIIGVVAALTISNVMINTQAAHARTALKKGIASLNQAVLQSATVDGYDCAETVAAVAGSSLPSVYNIVEKHLGAKQLLATSKWDIYANFIAAPTDISATAGAGAYATVLDSEVADMKSYYYYMLPDSMVLIMPPNMVSCGEPRLLNSGDATGRIPTTFDAAGNEACIAFLDINGAKGPNQVIGCESQPTNIPEMNDPPADFVLEDGFFGQPYTCPIREKAITDVYPVVFYNDKVYPVTYAANTVFMQAEQVD